MPERRVYDVGDCKQCGRPFRKKPARKEFCSRFCKDRYHNGARGRVTAQTAQEWIEDHWVTIRQAADMGVATASQIRAMVRRRKLEARRMFGRVLLRRSDVERLIKRALLERES